MPYRTLRRNGWLNRVMWRRKSSRNRTGNAIAAWVWPGSASQASSQRGGGLLSALTELQPAPVGRHRLVPGPGLGGDRDEVVGQRLVGEALEVVLADTHSGQRLEADLGQQPAHPGHRARAVIATVVGQANRIRDPLELLGRVPALAIERLG